MDEIKLSDRQWAAVAPCLPGQPWTGRRRLGDRRCFEAVLCVLLTGCGWYGLPPGSSAPVTAWRRLRIWQQTGAWPRLWRAYVLSLDAAGRKAWSRALLAGAFLPAPRNERRLAEPLRRRALVGLAVPARSRPRTEVGKKETRGR